MLIKEILQFFTGTVGFVCIDMSAYIYNLYFSDPVTEEPKHQPEPSQTEAEPSQKEAAGSEPSVEEEKSQSEGGGGWFSSWGVSNISNMVQKSVSNHLTSMSHRN